MEIPCWPVARLLCSDDKAQFDAIFAELQPRVSELTFAGLYLFRAAHDYQVSRFGDSIIVLGKGYDGDRYCMTPLGGDMAAAAAELLKSRISIYGADETFVSTCCAGSGFEIIEERDSYDYLYLREELADLPGNRFHKKKNRINYFTSRHSFQVHVFSAVYLSGCLELLDEWGRAAEIEDNRSFALELDATGEALTQAATLGLKGVVVEVEGHVKAFALGERLNNDTAVCHFEKADHFMEGVSQLVNREFCRLLFTDCRYINREQDLGEPGLRNAKLSYHPVELVKKYRIVGRR
jgi:hypothetical protein